MNTLRTPWRLTMSAACVLALLALASPAWTGGGQDKDKGQEKDKDKGETKGLGKPFEQVTLDADALDKQFKVLKVSGKNNEQSFYVLSCALVAKHKLDVGMLNELLTKTELRFYAGDIIVGRYVLQPADPQQMQRGLVKDEKMVVHVQLAPDAVRKLAEEKPTRAALVKTE